MGNTAPPLMSLQFIQTMEDSNFGCIQIYKSEQGKFIMKNRQSFITGDKRQTQFRKVLKFLYSSEHTCIVPILHLSQKHQSNICIEYQIIESYVEYYNFTLLDMLKCGKTMDQSELWFTLKMLLELLGLLRDAKIVINFALNNIFLTLKGNPVVYAFHMLASEESIGFTRLTMEQAVALIVLQLAALQILPEDIEMPSGVLEEIKQKVRNRYPALLAVLNGLLIGEFNCYSAMSFVTKLEEDEEIKIAAEIRLNKFKYVVPVQSLHLMPPAWVKQNQSGTLNNNNLPKSSTTPKASKTPGITPEPQGLKPLKRAKGQQNRITIPSMESTNKIKEMLKDIDSQPLKELHHSNLTCKGSHNRNLSREIEEKKKASQQQRNKMLERKRLVLDRNTDFSYRHSLLDSGLTTNKNKDSWTRKAINQQLKSSHRN